MGEAENLSNAAQALTTAAQQYASAASEMMGVTGSAVALGHDLSTTWKGQASDSFLNSLDKLSGDGFNLMTAFDQASTVMNGLALAIRSQLDAISKAERLQQQAEGFEQLTPEVLNQLNQAQGVANAAMSTLTYLANSAASSLESVNTVGVCSTGLGVFNLDIQTPSKDGKTTIMVDGKPMLVIDDATGQILENYTNGGSGSGGGGDGGGGGGTNGPWWHEWWGKDASLWKRVLLKLAIGYSVSGISNGTNVVAQGKPWNWEAFLIQGGVLSAAYESSILMGFKGPVDKIYSALITAIYGSVAYGFNIGGSKPKPSPGPAPTPIATTPPPTHSSSPSSTPSPSPSLSPHASAPPPIH